MKTADELLADSAQRHDPRAWIDAQRIDLAYQDGIGPCLLLYAADGTRHRHPLTPAETYALVRQLVGWLGYFHHTTPTDPEPAP